MKMTVLRVVCNVPPGNAPETSLAVKLSALEDDNRKA